MPVTDPDGLCAVIAAAVGASDARHPGVTVLIDALRDTRLLLLLDNFEHVLAAAPLVTDLLRGCSQLKVLATSRAALRLSGEQAFPVPPLPVPDPEHLPAMALLRDYAAVRLFIDRAMRVRPDFALTPTNAPDIAAICALLDGLPLAVELAAARVRTLPPRSLVERLHASHRASLGLLAGGPRDAPERQQTLRSTIAWSYGLLAPRAQVVFRHLAVFSGGWTLEAIDAICGALSEIDIIDPLEALVDNSLVTHDEGPDGASRFRHAGDGAGVRLGATRRRRRRGSRCAARHADYYLGLVKATGRAAVCRVTARGEAGGRAGERAGGAALAGAARVRPGAPAPEPRRVCCMKPAMSMCAQCSTSWPPGDAVDGDAADLDDLARRLEAEELPEKGGPHRHAGHDLVPFRHLVVDGVDGVREGGGKGEAGLADAFPAGRQVGQRRVVIHVVERGATRR